MGEVYLARDRRLGRQVALKMLAGRFHSEAHLRERFVSEARAVSALEHPHVCRLYDVGEWKGRPYFTMERLRGETLRERLRRGPLAAVEVRRIGAEVAGALAAAHDVGILHCDIKPSNLFLTEDAGAKVMDFGIARRLQTNFGSGGGAAGAASTASPAPPASEDSTVIGEWRAGAAPAGTPYYMRPSKCGAMNSMAAPICFRWARCCIKWPRGGSRSKAGPWWKSMRRFCGNSRPR